MNPAPVLTPPPGSNAAAPRPAARGTRPRHRPAQVKSPRSVAHWARRRRRRRRISPRFASARSTSGYKRVGEGGSMPARNRIQSVSSWFLILCLIPRISPAAQRVERFDKDPNWDGHNNRQAAAREIKQDFGYSTTANAGGKKGEIGGVITPAAEPAYYARKIPPKGFDDELSASGTFAIADGPLHVLVGFFNADTLNEWRTPNTIALRLQGRGDFFYAYVEYCTSRWRAGGDSPTPFPTARDPRTGREQFIGFPSKGTVHK